MNTTTNAVTTDSQDFITHGRPWIIYGALDSGKAARAYLESQGQRIVAFCDGNASLWGTYTTGEIPIISPDYLKDQSFSDATVVIASSGYLDILVTLASLGRTAAWLWKAGVLSPVLPSPPILPKRKVMLISTLPKSGTNYMTEVLRSCLRPYLKYFWAQGGNWPDTRPCLQALNYEDGIFSVFHLSATEANVEDFLTHGVDRLTVHFRDPREAIISYTHFLNRKMGAVFPPAMRPEQPDYFRLTFREQLDYQISRVYPRYVEYITHWHRLEKLYRGRFAIQLTRFSDLKLRPREFFKSIVEFHQLPFDPFSESVLLPVEAHAHYRKGSLRSWEKEMSPAQAELVTSMIPQEVLGILGDG